MKMVRNLFILALMLMVVLAGCGSPGQRTKDTLQNQEQQQGENLQKYEPVTIENFGRALTFTETPKRAVSLNQHTTEIMLALGLEKYMVGTAYLDDEILPEFKDKYAKIPVLAEKYPSLEVLLGADPDFVIGRKSAFNEKNIDSVEGLAEKGITAYVVKGTYVTAATMEDVYEDILNLGRIFNVESKSKELVESMRQRIQEINNIVGKVANPLRVLVYDSGQDTVFTSGQSLETSLIALAGGKNVFDDIPKSWAEVSWEEVLKRDPEVIVINDYDKPGAQEKIQSLLNNPVLADVTAIKNKRFVVLPLSDVFEGVRNVRAVETLAQGFYPRKFK